MNETVTEGWGDTGEVMARLVGSWSLDRVIAGQGSMQGIATFTPLDEMSLAYREQGRLTLLDGTALEAEREYVFRESGRGFEVFFKVTPLRLFHSISLSASGGGALKVRGRYRVKAAPPPTRLSTSISPPDCLAKP